MSDGPLWVINALAHPLTDKATASSAGGICASAHMPIARRALQWVAGWALGGFSGHSQVPFGSREGLDMVGSLRQQDMGA
jgi:hypothetical protein